MKRLRTEHEVETSIVFIIDGSTSMNPQRSDVIAGVMANLRTCLEKSDNVSVTIVSFNNEVKSIINKIKLSSDNLDQIETTLNAEYTCKGYTALFDAIGLTLSGLSADDKALVVVATDGLDNESKLYKKENIASMINQFQTSGRCSFIFLCEGVEAFNDSQSAGLTTGQNTQSMLLKPGSMGVFMRSRQMSDSLSQSMEYLRTQPNAAAPLLRNPSVDIDNSIVAETRGANAMDGGEDDVDQESFNIPQNN